MARPRILNPDDAKALRKLGLTYTAIGELLGVSHQTVRRACDDQARARLDANAEKRNKAGAPCPACGERMSHVTAKRGGMCHACATRARRSWVDADGVVDGALFEQYRQAMNDVRGSEAWQRTRKVVLDRDSFTCQLCGGYGDTVDHYPPLFVQLVRGGSGTDPNACRALCKSCSSRIEGERRRRATIPTIVNVVTSNVPSDLTLWRFVATFPCSYPYCARSQVTTPSLAERPGPTAGAFAFTDTNHMPRYCVDCGTITATGNRCPRHAAHHHSTRRSVYSSKRWQHVRRLAMERSGYRCAACGLGPSPSDPLTAHHADYADPYDPTSIVVLHRSCHGKQHGGQRSVA